MHGILLKLRSSLNRVLVTNLFAHRLRHGDRSRELQLQVESAVQASPVPETISRVRQAPRNQGLLNGWSETLDLFAFV
jgi:hypothetical protein